MVGGSLTMAASEASASGCDSPVFTGCVLINNGTRDVHSFRLQVIQPNGHSWSRCLTGTRPGGNTSYYPGVWFSQRDAVFTTAYTGGNCEGWSKTDNCGLLASCSGSGTPPAAVTSPSASLSGAPSASPSAAGRVTAASPSSMPSAHASVKTLPPSRLCAVLDSAAARLVLADPRQAPRVAPAQSTAPESCGYASGDRTSLLTLTPSTRSYDTERSAARSLVRDPASAGMRDVKVTGVTGLGQAGFSERAEVLQPRQSVSFVVWSAGSRVWVLTLAQPVGAKDGADRLVPLARQITPRLAG